LTEGGGTDDPEILPAAYAAWRASTLGRITDRLEQDLILDQIGPPTGRRILDVGCGDGVLAVGLARRGANVVGVDVSSDMLAAARSRALGEGQNVTFDEARAEALPFATGAFDTVVAVTVLCFVADASAGLTEMARVLRPGGLLVVGELGKWNCWAAKRRVQGWVGSPVWRRARFRTPPELRTLASQAGLVDVEVRGAVFYPSHGVAARLLAPIDCKIGAVTTVGAAFLALTARKPGTAPQDIEVG